MNPSSSSRPTSSSAPSVDPQIISIPNTPFYFHANEKTWDDCKSHAENYHFTFASIRNQAENDGVVDYFWSNNIRSNVWLGGYQTSYEDEPAGNWAWLDGTPWTDFTYTNWREEQGYYYDAHYLVLLSERGKWVDVPKQWGFQCLFRDPLSSLAQNNAPTSEPATSSKTAPTTAPLNIEELTSTVLKLFESIVTFFKNLLPF